MATHGAKTGTKGLEPRRRRRRRSATLLAGVLSGALLLSGCGGSGEASDSDTLTWATTIAPTVIDIAHGFTTASTLVQFAVLETPVSMTGAGELVPQLAEKWEETAPGTYAFTLRDDVTFSDGTPVTSEDMAYSLQRHLDPAIASQAASMVADVVSVEATDDRTVTVTLKGPSATFLYNAALVWQVFPKKLAEAHPDDLGTPEAPAVGTGPYTIEKFSLTDGVTLQRRDDYWGEAPEFATVKVPAISDPEALRLAISSGAVDGTSDVPPADARKWEKLSHATSRFFPSNSIAMIALNVQDERLADVHVRRAIAYALNRDSIRGLAGGAEAEPAQALGTLPQLQNLYGGELDAVIDGLPQYDHDVAKAREELAKSPYPDGFTISAFRAADDPYAAAWQSIIADLAEIGIVVELDELSADAFFAKRNGHDGLTIGMHGFAYGTPDIGEVLPDLLSSGSAQTGFNFSHYTSPELDAKLDQVISLQGAERQAAVTGVLAEVADQVPYVPLYYSKAGVAVNDRLEEEITALTLDVFSAVGLKD